MTQRTLSIIKPDAVQRNLQGAILKMIQDSGLKIVAMKMLRLSKEEAGGFYFVHQDKPFFDSLTDYMSSGPIVVSILEGENCIDKYREIMGATNPENAQEGTIRKAYALDIEKNSVHGSDATETAQVEMAYFFSKMEMVG